MNTTTSRQWIKAMACLEVLEGFHCGERFPLPDDAYIGRHPESLLCLPEHHVSRRHARLLRRGNTFVIEDLLSSNGVIVQGKRLLPDDAAQPGVALTLDASMNWLEVRDTEKRTDKGLQEALKRLQAMCQVSTALGAI